MKSKFYKKFIFIDCMGNSYYDVYRRSTTLIVFDNAIKCNTYPLVELAANKLCETLNADYTERRHNVSNQEKRN